MRVGIAHHFGWAVAVTASADHEVVDRRRIELIEPGVPAAPIHHEGGPHLLHRQTCRSTTTRSRRWWRRCERRRSGRRRRRWTSSRPTLAEPIVSMSLRAWPADFPEDIAVQRRVPYESRADSVMYRQVLAELAHDRGWDVHLFNAKDVEAEAVRILGERADEVLHGPGRRWDRRGRRTIGWRWRPRSSPPADSHSAWGRRGRRAAPRPGARSRRGSGARPRRPGRRGRRAPSPRSACRGTNGQASPQPIVTTTSAACTISSVHGFGELAGDVDADLGHGRDGDGVDLGRRARSPPDQADGPVAGEVVEPAERHLRPAGVVHAEEEHGRAGHLGSCRSFVVVGARRRSSAGSVGVEEPDERRRRGARRRAGLTMNAGTDDGRDAGEGVA